MSCSVAAVIFDLSGTVLDHGSRGPVIAFVELFRRHGVTVTEAAARAPMGAQKRDHIVAMFARPDVAEAWLAVHGKPVDEATLDRMYDEFLPLQIEVLERHSDVLPGVAELTKELRARGIRFCTTTGFDSRMIDGLKRTAIAQGFEPELFLTPDVVGAGRPAPWMIHHAARHMNVYPSWRIVKVGDTPIDIAEAQNAGTWAVAVIDTGNEIGLSAEALAALPGREALVAAARERFEKLGAHYTIASSADLLPVIEDINRRLALGERPNA